MSKDPGLLHSKGIFSCTLLLLVLTAYVAKAAESEWSTPRTEHGQPDLQGIWYFGTNTPFERPADLGEKRAYTEAEALQVEHDMREANWSLEAPLDPDRGAPEAGATILFQADFNFAAKRNSLTRVNGEYRTSVIIDPPDGRVPLQAGFISYTSQRRTLMGVSSYDGPESADGRCLGGLAVGSLYPTPWNANLQIVQTEDYVMIMTEMIHDARIVRLNGSHRDNGLDYWSGDSVGHWEGDTLVVRTINFRLEQSIGFMGLPLSEEFELTEWFTPVNENEILYSFTIVDPQAYTRPFTTERTIQRRKAGEHIYEYACHEGNYSMIGLLTGARRAEIDAREELR